jgi:hypothetical protein
MSNTVRRDKLLRLAKAGKLVMVDSYHFDDSFGVSRIKNELPVRIWAYGDPREEGFAYVMASDFEGNAGRAYKSKDDTIVLYVHSNCNYTFRIVEGK